MSANILNVIHRIFTNKFYTWILTVYVFPPLFPTHPVFGLRPLYGLFGAMRYDSMALWRFWAKG